MVVPSLSAAEGLGPHYPHRPSEAVIQQFLEHVRATGQPETFPTIDRSRPKQDSRPIYLRRFDVERKKRPNGDLAPCPICSPDDPKFVRGGYLTWYPDEGALRAIGPECGDAVFGGEMYAGAKAQYSIDERQRVAEEFLEANLVKVLSMHVALERVRPAAAEAQRLYTQIRTLIPDILDQLKLVRRNGFELVVSLAVELPEDASEEIAVVGPRGLERGLTTDAASQVSFGYLPDTPMLYSRFQPVKDHADVAQLLAALPRAASKEEAFDWICDNSRLDHLEQGVRMMRRASHLYLRMIERLDRFNSFFTRRNFTALNKWGQHPNNAFDLKAEVNLERFSLSHSGRGRWEHEELVLTPNMAALTARGDWPGFE